MAKNTITIADLKKLDSEQLDEILSSLDVGEKLPMSDRIGGVVGKAGNFLMWGVSKAASATSETLSAIVARSELTEPAHLVAMIEGTRDNDNIIVAGNLTIKNYWEEPEKTAKMINDCGGVHIRGTQTISEELRVWMKVSGVKVSGPGAIQLQSDKDKMDLIVKVLNK